MLERLKNVKRPVWYVIGGLLLLLVLFNIPVNQHNTITRGVDQYTAHRPLFGDRTQAQDVKISRGLQGVGAILVNLTHTTKLTDIVVSVSDPETGQILREATIPGQTITDDEFTSVTFAEPLRLTNKVVRITLSDPQATSANALGVRFNPKDVYPASTRLEKGHPETGDLSLTLVERVPIWKFLQTAIVQNPDRAWLLATAVGITLLVSLLIVFVPTLVTKPRLKWLPLILVIIIALLSTWWRLSIIPQFKGVSGGDPYNYLFITQKIAHGENPLNDTKRLPGFPLLLLPAYLTNLDDQSWMRGVSVLSAALILVVLPFLAKKIGLPWSVQLLAVVILTITKDFWRTSLRPEPYTFYALLVLLAVWLLYKLDNWRWQLALGFVLGYAAMTRQEGFVLAVVIAACTLPQWRTLWWRGYLRIFIPAFILVLPFFIHNTAEYGNPLFTPYFDGDRLQIVDSWPAFVDNTGAAWGVLGTWWWPRWEQESRVSFTQPLFLITLFGTLIWNILKQLPRVRKSSVLVWLAGSLGILLLVGTIWFSVTAKASVIQWLLFTTSGLLVGSVLSWPITTRWKGLPILLVAVSQGLIAVWFHPFAKHFQQIWPLLCLMLASALSWPTLASSTWRVKVASIFWYLGLLTPLAVGNLWLWQAWPVELDRHNESTALDSVVYRAVRDARKHVGPYGVDQAYLPARLYFDEGGQYFAGDEPHTAADETAWLTRFNIHTLIVTNNNPAFENLPEGWQLVAHHKSAGKNEKIYESWVYILP